MILKYEYAIFILMAITLAEQLADLKARLAQVQEAIALAEKGQEYSLDDGQGKQAVKRGDLRILYAREEKLENQILRIEGGGTKTFNARLQ